LQNSRCRLFSIIIELFFYWKSRGIGPWSHGPQVHGFGSWVHGIVDQSRSLILIRATMILLKWKDIDDLIPALHLRATTHITPGWRGRCIGPVRRCYRGLTEAPLQSSLGPGDAGFWGQNDARRDGVLTRGETRWGTAPRWLTAVASLLWAQATVSGGSGTLPTSISSSTPSSWPPRAYRPVQWLQSTTFSSNFVAARVQRDSSFAS
jgi:hypothetical protein